MERRQGKKSKKYTLGEALKNHSLFVVFSNEALKEGQGIFPFFPGFFPLGKTRQHKGKAETPSATTRQQEKGVWGKEGQKKSKERRVLLCFLRIRFRCGRKSGCFLTRPGHLDRRGNVTAPISRGLPLQSLSNSSRMAAAAWRAPPSTWPEEEMRKRSFSRAWWTAFSRRRASFFRPR